VTARKILLSTTPLARGLLPACALAASLVAAAPQARAAGYGLLEQSAESQGASHAGSAARADDPSTLFFNPAGMARLPGNQATVSGSFIDPQALMGSGSATTNVTGGKFPVAGTVRHDAGKSAVLPAMFVTTEFAPDWHAGLSVTSPFGLATSYDATSIARYYALNSKLMTIDIAPAVAWQATPALSLGAAAIIETAAATLSSAVDFGTIGAGLGLGSLGLLPGRADGVSTLRGTDVAPGFQLGALYQVAPGTRIGLSYRSTIYHRLHGNVDFASVPAALASAFPTRSASAKLITPGNVSLGIAHEIGPVTLLGGLTWTQWSRFHDLYATYAGGSSLTQEHWRDTYTVSAGADWRINESFTVRGGVAWDQTPVTDQYRTPLIPDGNRFWTSVGATWNATASTALSVAYTHIFVSSPSLALTDLGSGTPNYLRGNLSASYTGQVNIVAAQAKFAF